MAHLWVAVTLLSWGVAGVFDKKAVENGTSRAAFLAFHLFNVPLTMVLLLVLPLIMGPMQLNARLVIWEGLDAVCAMAALLFYYQAMIRSEASWVLGITAGYPIVGQLLAFLVLGEPFSWLALLASATVSAGIAAIGYSGAAEYRAMDRRNRAILFACVVACTFLWAVLGVLDRVGLWYAPPMDGMLVVQLWKCLLATAAIPFLARGQVARDLLNTRLWTYSSVASALVFVGNIGFLLALMLVPTGYAIVVTACYPLIMYICAITFLRERLNLLRAVGIGITVAGLVVAELGRVG